MGRIKVAAFSISADGFGAGPAQSLENPLGEGGKAVHGWAFETRTFRRMFGEDGGSDGIDEGFARASMEGLGAWIMGRNMFGPVRGDWRDEDWKGWWGDNPPYHVPVFVLTHYPRAPIEMEGGTVFHFVTDGLDAAVGRAREAAGDLDIRIGGGVATLREAFTAGVIDEAHLAVSPVLLGRGEALFSGLDLPGLGYEIADRVAGENATHLVLRRRGPDS